MAIRNHRIQKYKEICSEIQNIVKNSQLEIKAIYLNGYLEFYPKGVNSLDEKLIEDNLMWLSNYPNTHKPFKDALNFYKKRKYDRNLLDNLRVSMEQLLKTIMKNDKPIEKQKEDLGNYLKDKKITKEIRNLYSGLLGHFTKYQNNNVKHNEKYNSEEIEFMIYLTGTFIRFLIQLEDREK